VGLQNFKEIIEDNFVYADKTRDIYKLNSGGKYYFLSRPRRFGKSLLLDTMQEIFAGNRELFRGLWIDSSDFDWKVHPVIRLDMSQMDTKDADSLEDSVKGTLLKQAGQEGVAIDSRIITNVFCELISGLRDKYGQRVVVLVDEYDKPILDHILDQKAAEATRNILRSVYGILKGMDADLHFVFLTGITRLSEKGIAEAFAQIEARQYAAKYTDTGIQVIKVAIVVVGRSEVVVRST
jgi:hypothetical protein